MTQSELKELLDYNPDTGLFVWKQNKSKKIKAGTLAGSIKDSGYLRIKINNKIYPAHRLAWIYMYDVEPKIIDHINGIKTDNRICNLRNCNNTQNQWNSKLSITNTSGIKGVCWVASRNKWRVQIKVNNISKHIGYFDNLEFAELVAQEARSKYHGLFANNG